MKFTKNEIETMISKAAEISVEKMVNEIDHLPMYMNSYGIMNTCMENVQLEIEKGELDKLILYSGASEVQVCFDDINKILHLNPGLYAIEVNEMGWIILEEE